MFNVLQLAVVLVLCFDISNAAKKTKEKPIPKSKPEDRKENSNAHNFIDAASDVDRRTGTFSFSLTVGHIVTHFRRFRIKLIYSQPDAQLGENPYFLGNGWSLNLPRISSTPTGKLLHLGDGTKYHILSQAGNLLPIQYYDKKDIKITFDDLSYSIKKNGDTYMIDSGTGLIKLFMSREGFTLSFSSGQTFTAFNEIDEVLRISANGKHNGSFIVTQTSMGMVKYETQHIEHALQKIVCHSCTGPSKEYTFTMKPKYEFLIQEIQYPSGLIEHVKYIQIGDESLGRAYGVSKLVRTPGTNFDLLAINITTPEFISEYNYDPKKTGHDFKGSGFAVYRTDGLDPLLEVNGDYEYWVEKKIGSTCTLLKFNKMHLLMKSTTMECSTPKFQLNKKECQDLDPGSGMYGRTNVIWDSCLISSETSKTWGEAHLSCNEYGAGTLVDLVARTKRVQFNQTLFYAWSGNFSWSFWILKTYISLKNPAFNVKIGPFMGGDGSLPYVCQYPLGPLPPIENAECRSLDHNSGVWKYRTYVFKKTCMISSTNIITWEQANLSCNVYEKGHLAVIFNRSEQHEFEKMVKYWGGSGEWIFWVMKGWNKKVKRHPAFKLKRGIYESRARVNAYVCQYEMASPGPVDASACQRLDRGRGTKRRTHVIWNSCIITSENTLGTNWLWANKSCNRFSNGHLVNIDTADKEFQFRGTLLEWGGTDKWWYWILKGPTPVRNPAFSILDGVYDGGTGSNGMYACQYEFGGEHDLHVGLTQTYGKKMKRGNIKIKGIKGLDTYRMKKTNDGKILEQTKYEYSCLSNATYSVMKEICDKHIAYYMQPKKVIKEVYGKSGIYSETTHYKYDDYGNVIETTSPNGEIKSIEYNFTEEFGELKLPLYKTHSPTPGSDYTTRRTNFVYKDLAKWPGTTEAFLVEIESTDYYIMKVSGAARPIRKSLKEYYEIFDHKYGRIRTKTVQSAGRSDSSESIDFYYDYHVSAGKLETTTYINQNNPDVQVSEMMKHTIDVTTALQLEQINIDQTKLLYNYNMEGQLAKEILRSNKEGDSDIVTEYSYKTQSNKNQKLTTYPDGRMNFVKYDNANNILENDIFVEGKVFPVKTFEYDTTWNLVVERSHYQKRVESDTVMFTLKTTMKYDNLSRIIEKTMPSNVTEFVEYDSYSEAIITLTFLKHETSRTIPDCTVERFQKPIRKCQLTGAKYDSNNPCNINDCLSVEIITYDGYSRISSSQTFGHKNESRQAVEERIYDQKGFLKSKTTKAEGKTLLNTRYSSSNVFGKVLNIWVKKDDERIKIASRHLNPFGRIKTQIHEGVTATNNYNYKGQIAEEWYGVRYVRRNMKYDGFGRIDRIAGEHQKNPDAKVTELTTFYPNGNIKSMEISYNNKVHKKNYNYDNALGLVSNYTYYADSNNGNKVEFVLEKIYDELGRISFEKDFRNYIYNYSYNIRGELDNVTVTKGMQQYFITHSYNAFGVLHGYTYLDKIKSKGYSTKLSFDEYQRVIEIKYEQVEPPKIIGKVSYKYDNFDQITEKKLNEKTTETFQYDDVGRIRIYRCNQIDNNALWKCPEFTDGIQPSTKKSHLKLEIFSYDIFNNINWTESESNENEKVRKTYRYDSNYPTQLNLLLIKRENMENVEIELEQRYIYDKRGNVEKIYSGEKEEYVLRYDAMGKNYWSSHDGLILTKYHDEDGQIFYHTSQKGDEIKEKWIMHDDNNKLRSDLSDGQSGSWVYVSEMKTAYLKDQENLWKYYCLDLAGSVISAMGKEKEQHFSYSPFGCNYRNTTTNPIGYQNMWANQQDMIVAENGRLYAPWIGRFLQRDPLSPFGESGIKDYTFADNSPILKGDPTGFFTFNFPGLASIAAPFRRFGFYIRQRMRPSVPLRPWQQRGAQATYNIGNVPKRLVNNFLCHHRATYDAMANLLPSGQINLAEFTNFPARHAAYRDFIYESTAVGRDQTVNLFERYVQGYRLERIGSIHNLNNPQSWSNLHRPSLAGVRTAADQIGAEGVLFRGAYQNVGVARPRFNEVSHVFSAGKSLRGWRGRIPILRNRYRLWGDSMRRSLNDYFGPAVSGQVPSFQHYEIYGIVKANDMFLYTP